MKLRFILLCSTLFASFASFAHYKNWGHDHPHPDYNALHNWTNKEGKAISGHFKDFDEDTKTLYIEHKGRKINIPFENLSEKSQKLVRQFMREENKQTPQEPKPEPQFIPKDAAQKILLARIENLERMVIQRDKQVEALAKQIGMIHDQKNRDIKSGNFKRAMESMNRQADEHNLQDMQNRIERIEFDRMSDGSGGF